MTRRELTGDDELPIDPDVALAEPGARPVSGAGASVRRRPRAEPSVLVAVALGGALGAPARYGVAQLVRVPTGGFPWATFWTNVSGSFALGVVVPLPEADRHVVASVAGLADGFEVRSAEVRRVDMNEGGSEQG